MHLFVSIKIWNNRQTVDGILGSKVKYDGKKRRLLGSEISEKRDRENENNAERKYN